MCAHCGKECDQHASTDALPRFCEALRKGCMRELSLDLSECERFTPAAARQLGASLPRSLRTLELRFDDSADHLLAALAAGLPDGALPVCEALTLDSTLAGDVGIAAFADALCAGALGKAAEAEQRGSKGIAPKAKKFSVWIGGGGGGAAAAAAKARDSADASLKGLTQQASLPLPACRALYLHGSRAGDDGLKALATALSAGALAACSARSELEPARPSGTWPAHS